jgi:hypothetical protein
MRDVNIYQIISHILKTMGYSFLSKEVFRADHKELNFYIKFIRSKSITNKSLVEFIDYYL